MPRLRLALGLVVGFGLCLNAISGSTISAADDGPDVGSDRNDPSLASPAKDAAAAAGGGGSSSPGPDRRHDGPDDDAPSFDQNTLRIPRESNLSLQDYYERYADTETPVIITDYASAFAEMTKHNILDVCGTAHASVARRVSDDEAKWAGIDWFNSKYDNLADTVRAVAEESTWGGASSSSSGGGGLGGDGADNPEQPPREGSIVGVFDWSLPTYCPDILEDHFVMPKYLAQDFLQRIPSTVAINYRDAWPSLFVGVDGTYGGLHRDVFGSSFWMYVVEGAKEWHVVDSVEGTDYFAANPTSNHHPPALRHYHDIVRTGELLIIPGNRWHQVRNVGATLTLAGNFISRGSFDTMKRVLKNDPIHSGEKWYKQLERTLLRPNFDTTVDYDQGDMTWRQFKDQGSRYYDTFTQATQDVLAVLVTGAGSPEVNGCYLFNGMNAGAFQFLKFELLRNDDNNGGGGGGGGGSVGRTFELFKVKSSSGWWNIMERIDDDDDGSSSYPHPPHYGSLHDDADAGMPPKNGWGGTDLKEEWLGRGPMPSVAVLDRDRCVQRGRRVGRAKANE